MEDSGIEYAGERARNLSRELMLREENEIANSDTELCATALVSYATALCQKKAGKDLGDMERSIIARHAGELASLIRGRNVSYLGPTDSELCSRALNFYTRQRTTKVRTALAEAA